MHLLREIEKLFCDLAARDVPSQYKSSQTGDQRQFSESRRNVTGRFIRLDQGLPVSSSSTTDVKQELPKHSDQVHALGKRSFYSVHEREDLGFNHLLWTARLCQDFRICLGFTVGQWSMACENAYLRVPASVSVRVYLCLSLFLSLGPSMCI